jgi:hypothetical protein
MVGTKAIRSPWALFALENARMLLASENLSTCTIVAGADLDMFDQQINVRALHGNRVKAASDLNGKFPSRKLCYASCLRYTTHDKKATDGIGTRQ